MPTAAEKAYPRGKVHMTSTAKNEGGKAKMQQKMAMKRLDSNRTIKSRVTYQADSRK